MPKDNREINWLAYILLGIYGSISWYWFRRGKLDGFIDGLNEASYKQGQVTEPCDPCEPDEDCGPVENGSVPTSAEPDEQG